MFGGTWDPAEVFRNGDVESLLEGQYWNYPTKKSFSEGQVSVGFIKLDEPDLWLLFHIGKITKDLNIYDGVGYEHDTLPEYEKYFGRLIIRYKNTAQTMIRLATSVIDTCEVHQILPDVFDSDIFPGYENVNINWTELARVTTKEGWSSALRNQKGVYLLTDTSNGKMYVGSAYGDEMLLGRWISYVKNGHGNNAELKKLGKDHIQRHFRYSILDIYKSTTADKTILARESWWKNTLMARQHGYNLN